jgi:hypothetical protein
LAYQYQPVFPVVERQASAIDKLRPPFLGTDMEWDIQTGRPTIIGVSDGTTTVSTAFDSGWPHVCALLDRYPGAWTFVGHNLVQAERPIFERFGRQIPLEKIQDTIAWHYLTSAHLCKAGGSKKGDNNDINVRGGGFMNIWTMCSIWTSLARWKDCTGPGCPNSGLPCPHHDPFGYNGIDSLGPLLALKPMIARAKLLGVDKLYPLHLALLDQFQIMKERGVWVNRDYISQLRAAFLLEKEKMWGQDQKKPTADSMPFNPRAHLQVKKFFSEKYDIHLPDTEEETIREYTAENPEIVELQNLLAYKELGNGPDRWYADKSWSGTEWEGYVVDQGDGLGTIHPNLNYFTCTGRLACNDPNMLNIEKRRIDRATGEHVGERLRQAVVAPPGYNLYSADFRNAENFSFLILAGYKEIPKGDLHTWMVANIGIKETDEFALRLGGAREASKTVTHASDYCEGLDLITPERAKSKRIAAEIAAGARIVFDDWKFQDARVSFTGSNLARRAWGSATWENRRKALEMLERYLGKNGAFPKIRELQKRIFKQVEVHGAVITPEAYYLSSYDRRQEDRLKTACAFFGQNPVAHRLKLSLLKLEEHPSLIPVLPVHDEQVVYADARHDPKKVKGWIEDAMVFETPEIPGLKIPIKCKVGHNWRAMQTIE